MKDTEIIDRFVELRAQGWSFSRIAAELNVHKNTLLAWSRKHEQHIPSSAILTWEA
jgi:orotate phosphoribosyltransferase-like protein